MKKPENVGVMTPEEETECKILDMQRTEQPAFSMGWKGYSQAAVQDDVRTASGYALDRIGEMRGVRRGPLQADDGYRKSIQFHTMPAASEAGAVPVATLRGLIAEWEREYKQPPKVPGISNDRWCEGMESAANDIRILIDAAPSDAPAQQTEQERRACLAEDALADLLNQIRKTAPIDDHGHKLTMNMAYLKAVELLDQHYAKWGR